MPPTREMYLAQYCLDNVKELVYWLNHQGNFCYVNMQMCKVLGYTREELLILKYEQIRCQYSETYWHYQWEEMRKGKILELEVRLQAKDQAEIPVQIRGYYLKYQEQELICIFGKDLRHDKQRDELLRLTRYSLNHAQEMIYWIRPNGHFYYFNDAFATKLGYTREEVKTKKLLDFFPNFSQADFNMGWQRLTNGEILSSEMYIGHRNGFFIPVQTYVTLVRMEGETYACGILSDISERKRKEEELEQALAAIKSLQVQLQLDNVLLQEDIATEHPFKNIISTTNAYFKVLSQVEQVAPTDATVLLTGETGTGKELLARALHQLSRRTHRPLIKVNCTVLDPGELEKELFGYEKNAFAGALRRKIGKLELAHGGTVFLDEIGDLPLAVQAKLLRLLQEGILERLGSTESIQVDVRLVAATNRNLEQQVAEQRFRLDLFYRLHIFTIHNLPLRERRADIPLLAAHFVQKFSRKMGKKVSAIPPEILNELMEYDFPGNVRELENILERAVMLSDGEVLQRENPLFRASAAKPAPFKKLADLQRDHIVAALQTAKGQVSGENGAAKLLGMNDKTLYAKMQKLGIRRV
jgi:PAS domain S-box-containing protein